MKKSHPLWSKSRDYGYDAEKKKSISSRDINILDDIKKHTSLQNSLTQNKNRGKPLF